MRPLVFAFLVLLILLALSRPVAAEDFGAVGKVNKLLRIESAPQLAPGESGTFILELNSTYTEPIFNVTLTADIYLYATIEGATPVDGTWPYAFPIIRETGSRSRVWMLPTVPAQSVMPLDFTVVTAADSRAMPHGDIFSQSSYFVRFRLEFDGAVGASLERFVFASRGHFTQSQWDAATNRTNTTPCAPPGCRGNVNLTILGVDGVVPDTAFGVKEPIPVWPFYGLIVAAVVFTALAFLFWVEENPGAYPRIDVWWARTRGRFIRLRSALRVRRPPVL